MLTEERQNAILKELKEKGIIERIGSRKSGQWIVKQNFTQREDMKKKRPLDQEIYLPEYLSGTVARSF